MPTIDEKLGLVPTAARIGLEEAPQRSGASLIGLDDGGAGSPIQGRSLVTPTFGEQALDFISDQLDPLNLLLLASGGWLGAKLAAKVAGPLIVAGAGELPRLTKLLGEPARTLIAPTSRRLFKRAAMGLGWSLPFATAELFEEPDPGNTRIGEFARSLVAMEVMDLALFMPLGGAVNRLVGRTPAIRTARESAAATFSAAFKAAERKGVSRTEAVDAALADMLGSRVKQIETQLGPEAALNAVEIAQRLTKGSPDDFLQTGLGMALHDFAQNPQKVEQLKALGIGVEDLARLPELLRGEVAAASVIEAEKRAGEIAIGLAAKVKETFNFQNRLRIIDGKWNVGVKTEREISSEAKPILRENEAIIERDGKRIVERYTAVPLQDAKGREITNNWRRAFGNDENAKEQARRFIQNFDTRTRGYEPELLPGDPSDAAYQKAFGAKAAREAGITRPVPEPATNLLPDLQQADEATSSEALMQRGSEAEKETMLRAASPIARALAGKGNSFKARVLRAINPEQARETALPRKIDEEAGPTSESIQKVLRPRPPEPPPAPEAPKAPKKPTAKKTPPKKKKSH